MTFQINRRARAFLLVAGLAGLLTFPYPASAGGGVTVNTTDDTDDGVCNASHCSLREAINFANASPGNDQIAFQIPGQGVHEILLGSPLPPIASGVTINATTQSGYNGVPLVVLRAGPGVDVGLHLDGGDITVRGFSLVGFGPVDPSQVGPSIGSAIRVTAAAGNRIEQNYIGLLPSGQAEPNGIGILLEADNAIITGNVIAANSTGIAIQDGDHHTIQGNRIGTDSSGSFAPGPQACGICVHGGMDHTIGGPGQEGNLISGNGLGIYLTGGHFIRIYGNRIGTDASGTAPIPNSIGIWIEESWHARVGGAGGTEPGNLISGNTIGIHVGLLAGQTFISGNWIGTDATGEGTLPNASHGIESVCPNHITFIGGNVIQGNGGHGIALGGAAHHHDIFENTIRYNGGDGIGPASPLANPLENNTILQNSIYGNGGRGITVGWPEIPELTSVTLHQVSGTAGCAKCLIEIFVADPDPSGYGEGKTFLLQAPTDASGHFSADISGLVGYCAPITATVTNQDWHTSNFAYNRFTSCKIIPPYLIPLFVAPWIVFGSIVGVLLGRRRGLRPMRPAFLGGGIGTLTGIGLTALALALPSIQLGPWPRFPTGPVLRPTSTSTPSYLSDATSAAATAKALLTQMAAATPTPTRTATAAPTNTPTYTPVPTLISTPGPVYGILTMNAFCRRGPGLAYDIVTGYPTGHRGLLDGRNQENSWFRFQEHRCWTSGVALEFEGDPSTLPILPAPPTPTPTPAASFNVAYSYLEGCVGWDPGFEVVNTGAVAFRSGHITAKDTMTSTTVEDTTDVFDRRNGCAIAQSIPVLNPGQTGYIYANTFVYNPTRHPLQVTVTLCTGPGLSGTCLSRSLNVTP